MATRTIKFMGRAYSDSGNVSLTVNFNGSQVHNGEVTTKTYNDFDDKLMYEMFTFEVDSGLSGNIPVSVEVTGGQLFFGDLVGNYSGFITEYDEDTGELIVVTELVDFYGDLNVNAPDSDGKTNVKIDGVDQPREPIDEDQSLGEWQYAIPADTTFTCDFYIDPDLEILEIPEE